jgi:hypothetical protein
MSLSPKDDPRTWLVPGRTVPRPPLHARLLYYDLTKSQRALLRAMLEHAPEGALLEASLETYSETSGLSVRHIWNLIHGWERDGRRTPGLLECKVLERKRKARRGPFRKPAAYVFNEWALHLRPKLIAHLEAGVQQQLPTEGNEKGGSQVNHHGRVFRQPLPNISATVADNPGNSFRNLLPISETVADDSKATTTTAIDSTPGGFGRTSPGASNFHPRDLAKEFCERIAFAATRSNVDVIVAVLKVIQTKHGFETYAQCCEYLYGCVQGAKIPGYGSDTLDLKPRFFFEDGEYERFNPEAVAFLKEELTRRELSKARERMAADVAPGCITGKCQGCERPRFESSTWEDYCAESCRSAHGKKGAQRATA